MFEHCGNILVSPNPLHKMRLSKEYKGFCENMDKIRSYVNKLSSELIEILDAGKDANPEEFGRISKSYMGKLLQEPGVHRNIISSFVVGLMFAGVDTSAHITRWFLISLAKPRRNFLLNFKRS
jgi:hypothetical protein